MSITRAFTTRRVKQSLEAAEDAKMQRRSSNTTKGYSNLGSGPGLVRYKISAPVELIHTTNMLSYNAPDIFPRKVSDSPTTSSASSKSDDESDAHTNASTPPTSPDISSAPPPLKSQPNHLSTYFTTATIEKVSEPPVEKPTPTKSEAPVIPQRSPSHTKKAQDPPSWNVQIPARLSEQSTRSASTKAPSTFSRASSGSTNTSIASRSSAAPSHMAKASTSSLAAQAAPAVPPSPQPFQHRKQPSGSRHPFGQELAQVSELAEEFSIASKAMASAASKALEEEEKDMRSRGLHKLTADDYISEIRGLANFFFGETRPMGTVWI